MLEVLSDSILTTFLVLNRTSIVYCILLRFGQTITVSIASEVIHKIRLEFRDFLRPTLIHLFIYFFHILFFSPTYPRSQALV